MAASADVGQMAATVFSLFAVLAVTSNSFVYISFSGSDALVAAICVGRHRGSNQQQCR
jgi:hypothetical protein